MAPGTTMEQGDNRTRRQQEAEDHKPSGPPGARGVSLSWTSPYRWVSACPWLAWRGVVFTSALLDAPAQRGKPVPWGFTEGNYRLPSHNCQMLLYAFLFPC